jgi:hypothetical protein
MQVDRAQNLILPRLILEVRDIEQATHFLVGHGLVNMRSRH